MAKSKKKYYGDKVFTTCAGLVHLRVCAPTKLSKETVEKEANAQQPTGISSRWTTKDEADGLPEGATSNPWPCNDDPDRLHYLMVC